jgi:hypothetical protein
MYTRTVSAEAGNAAKASKSHTYLNPIREPIDVLEIMADPLYCTEQASLGVGVPRGQGTLARLFDHSLGRGQRTNRPAERAHAEEHRDLGSEDIRDGDAAVAGADDEMISADDITH